MGRSLRRADDRLRTALVTGGCSGIGRAIAERLAELGYELVLVSERGAELAIVVEELRARHGATAHAICCDLARPEAAAELYEAVRARWIAIDILVNNAGMFFFGEAVDAAPARANALLQLHVVTPSLLCTRFGGDMRARQRGHILMVSSLSAWRDFPGIAYYGASKRYLRGFARSLRSELSVYGVHVTCLMPGAVATGLYRSTTVPVALAQRLGVMAEPAAVADAGLRALFAGEAECMPGALTRAMALAAAVTPQPVVDALRRHAPWLPRR